MCDDSNGEIKYFIKNIAEDTRLFLEGEFDPSQSLVPRNVGVTYDDKNLSQVG